MDEGILVGCLDGLEGANELEPLGLLGLPVHTKIV